LVEQLSRFRESDEFLEDELRLVTLEERMARRDREIEALLGRLTQLEAQASTLHSDLVTELRTDVRTLKEEVKQNDSEMQKRLSALEERMQSHEREIAPLQCELSRRAQETSEVQRDVCIVRSESANVCRVLTEVRESTEALFSGLKADLKTLSDFTCAHTLSLSSLVISDFPEIFSEFRGRRFSLLWRGSRDGFNAGAFHSRCDGHASTLTVILDTNGNIFGGFTPVEWDSTSNYKTDPSLKSFLFTLKNPHNFPPRRFAVKADGNALRCLSDVGPYLRDMKVCADANANMDSFTCWFGDRYTNDTGIGGNPGQNTFFTGAHSFQAKEVEVFEIHS
jgi:predicted  nucleic acid-binding Zn-ribbon protein